MAKTANQLDHDCLRNLAYGIEIPDQASNACLIKMIGDSDGIDDFLQRRVRQAMFIS
jgi:hypothetical protein